jgi:hypothetical protein
MQVCRRRSTAYLDPRRLRRKTSHCDRLHSPLIGDETFSASESTFMPRWGPSGIGLLRCHGRTTGARTEQARPISGSGQGRPASFASTVKVQRSAVGSGSGRLGRVWPKSKLGRLRPSFIASPLRGLALRLDRAFKFSLSRLKSGQFFPEISNLLADCSQCGLGFFAHQVF